MPQLIVRTEVLIRAPAQRIWDLILDFENYPRWNPSIRRVRGHALPGEPAVLWVPLFPFGPCLPVHVIFFEVEPPLRLRWMGTLLVPALFCGDHRFILSPEEAGTIRLIQEETFHGMLVPLLAPLLRRRLGRLFHQTSMVFKQLAESRDRPATFPVKVGGPGEGRLRPDSSAG
ncbi:MAG TPA: SRPBCC domain-containing protein [Terriglobales bacterium]|nr:SRPBCC domain-containing protein [Terriglobales bacterium]